LCQSIAFDIAYFDQKNEWKQDHHRVVHNHFERLANSFDLRLLEDFLDPFLDFLLEDFLDPFLDFLLDDFLDPFLDFLDLFFEVFLDFFF